MKNTAIYCRVSTNNQESEGTRLPPGKPVEKEAMNEWSRGIMAVRVIL